MRYAQLPADIKKLNRQLESHFGVDTESMKQMWRVCWSDDQFEKRLSKHTAAGIELLFPEVMNLPKYPWIKGRWVLENLVNIPEPSQEELPQFKKSYECMYAFPTKDGMPIVPSFRACKFVFDMIQAVKGKTSLAKYKDPYAGLSTSDIKDKYEAEIKALEEELFGDESGLLGRTITGEAVGRTISDEKMLLP